MKFLHFFEGIKQIAVDPKSNLLFFIIITAFGHSSIENNKYSAKSVFVFSGSNEITIKHIARNFPLNSDIKNCIFVNAVEVRCYAHTVFPLN